MSLIDASKIPDLNALDPDAVRTSANALTTSGAGVKDSATQVVKVWGGLPTVYEAPEGPKLYSIMDPVLPAATGFETGSAAVASALHTYADAMETARAKVGSIKADAAAFEHKANHYQPQEVHTGDWYDFGQSTLANSWDQDPAMVKQNTALITSAYTALIEFENAQKTCAAAILAAANPNECVAPPQLLSTQLPKNAKTPWGTVSDKKESCGNKAQFFVPQLIGGVGKGLWSMAGGISQLTTGWDLHSWPPPSGFDALKAQGAAWTGLGETALGLAMAPSVFATGLMPDSMAKGPLKDYRDFNRMLGSKDLSFAGSLVGWQPPDKWWDGKSWTTMQDAGFSAWADDPGGQLGQSGVAIGSFFIPGAEGAGAIGKVGDVADVAKGADAVEGAELANGAHAADGANLGDLAPGANAGGLADIGSHISETAGGDLSIGGTAPFTENLHDLTGNLPVHDVAGHDVIVTDAPVHEAPPVHEAAPVHETAPVHEAAPVATHPEPAPVVTHPEPGAGDAHTTVTPDHTAPVDPAGSAHDGAAHDGTAHDGAAHDGPAPDGTAHHPIEVTGKDLPKVRQAFASNTHLLPNEVYHVEGRGTFYTDATGHVDRIQTEYGTTGKLNADLQKPIANATYEVSGPHGVHVFHTDSLARVDEVRVDALVRADAVRSPSIQQSVGALGGPGFDGGHLVGNVFGGGAERINMVSMIKHLNRGANDSYFNLENALRREIDAGNGSARIEFNIEIGYAGDTKVPSVFQTDYSINGGESHVAQFFNKPLP